MAQADYTVQNAAGADVRQDLNLNLQAIATVNSGPTEPTIVFQYQLWVDTTTNTLKQRNAANSGWVVIGDLGAIGFNLAPPIGSLSQYAGTVAPTKYLFCDGSAVSRSTYSELFAVCSTRYGAGDGVTTFNLPDLRGRTAIGTGAGVGLTNRILGLSGGAEQHSLDVTEMPGHNHELVGLINSGVEAGGFGLTPAQTFADRPIVLDQSPTPGSIVGGTSFTGGNAPHNNMQPFLVLNHIIRALH